MSAKARPRPDPGPNISFCSCALWRRSRWSRASIIGARCAASAPADGGFEAHTVAWQTATVFFAVIDLVAAVGLWLAAAWGAVIWLTSVVSMAAVEVFFPQVYGGSIFIVFVELTLLGVYLLSGDRFGARASVTVDLLIGDGEFLAAEQRDRHFDLFAIAENLILQNSERDLLAEDDRSIGIIAPVDPGVDAVAERHIVRKLVQLAIDVRFSDPV